MFINDLLASVCVHYWNVCPVLLRVRWLHVLLELWLGESVVQLHYYGIMYTAGCSSTRSLVPGPATRVKWTMTCLGKLHWLIPWPGEEEDWCASTLCTCTVLYAGRAHASVWEAAPATQVDLVEERICQVSLDQLCQNSQLQLWWVKFITSGPIPVLISMITKLLV